MSPYDSVEVRVKARDGVMVPLSILFAKNLKRDGKAPLLLDAYGAYGVDQDAASSPAALPGSTSAASSRSPTCAAAASSAKPGTWPARS